MAQILIQTVLAGRFLVAEPHRRTSDEVANIDWLGSSVLFGFAILAILTGGSIHAADARPPFAAAMCLMLLGLAYRYPAAAPSAAWAMLVALGTMLLWPVAREAGAEPRNLFPDFVGASPQPRRCAPT